MKKQLLKKLFASIIILMFSVGIVNAQCPANKVQMYKPVGRTSCISKCVPPNQVEKYVSNGWWYWCTNGGYGFFAKTQGKKIPNKPFVKIPAGNAIVSKKSVVDSQNRKG